MYKIREYTFDKFTLLGYYDKDALTTYGYPKNVPSMFTFYVGAPLAVIDIEDERVIEFISKNMEIYLKFKEKEDEIKGEKYADMITELVLKAKIFSDLVSKIVDNYGVSDQVDYELRNLDLEEVSGITKELRKMEELTGTMEGFDSFFPFWSFYGE